MTSSQLQNAKVEILGHITNSETHDPVCDLGKFVMDSESVDPNHHKDDYAIVDPATHAPKARLIIERFGSIASGRVFLQLIDKEHPPTPEELADTVPRALGYSHLQSAEIDTELAPVEDNVLAMAGFYRNPNSPKLRHVDALEPMAKAAGF
jgi:hypothetical protein